MSTSRKGTPCERSHARYLSVADTAQSVHPRGHPINHSTHVGFRLPPTCAASVGVFRFASDGALVSLALWAVGVGHIFGVGSHDPESIPLVGCSDVVRSQHTPPRIIPQRGKVTEDSGKSSVNKHR